MQVNNVNNTNFGAISANAMAKRLIVRDFNSFFDKRNFYNLIREQKGNSVNVHLTYRTKEEGKKYSKNIDNCYLIAKVGQKEFRKGLFETSFDMVKRAVKFAEEVGEFFGNKPVLKVKPAKKASFKEIMEILD